MAVKAKFQIYSSTKVMTHDPKEGRLVPGYTIIAHPVYTGSEENEKFFAATPRKLELGIINKAAADQLQPGSYIYLTMEPAEE